MSSLCSIPALGKAHARRLREIYRSAGWPCQDPLEIELLAAGMLDRVQAPSGHESLRVTDAGVRLLAANLDTTFPESRISRSRDEDLGHCPRQAVRVYEQLLHAEARSLHGEVV